MEWFWLTIGWPDTSKSKRKQNLIFIFDESKYHYTHNKIVTFFMNLMMIKEDAAFECLGACKLGYKNFVLLPSEEDGDRYMKIHDDKKKVLKLINKAAYFESVEYDTHFALGSAFYTSPDPQNI